jgi:hypothetical protein
MRKVTLKRLEFLKRVNERMTQHPVYKHGMVARFLPIGVLPDQANGFYIEGHHAVANDVLADAQAEVLREYEVTPPWNPQ